MKRSKCIIIDGNSVANRAFYALPLLTNAKGMPTNAVYGFTTMLLRLIEEEQPTHFLVAFDAGKITFRHKEYADYKGKRMKTPPELSEQFPLIKQMLESFGITCFELSGYEADDIIGTLTQAADRDKQEVLVVTGDKDMLQLASPQVTIGLTRKGISEMDRFDPQAISEHYGLKPEQIIDLKGLMGDASDNIPGVPGIGEKTGLKLLHQYGTVEEVLAHTEELKGKMKENIVNHREDAIMSKALATIYREVPMELDWETLRYEGYNQVQVATLFRELSFKSLLEKMDVPLEESGGIQEVLQWQQVDDEQMEQFYVELETVKAIHVETVGENPHRAELLGISFAAKERVWFLAVEDLDRPEYEAVKRWLEDEQSEKWIYDLHHSEVVLRWHGIAFAGASFDVLLAAYLLDPTLTAEHGWYGLTKKYELSSVPPDEEIYGKGAKFKLPEPALLGEHTARKAQAVADLVPRLAADLQAHEQTELLADLELPLSRVLAQMEATGVKLDEEGLQTYGDELSAQLSVIVEEIYELAGTTFNLNSPKQLGEVLFDKLGLPVVKKTKTGYSTDAEVLEKLESSHEVVAKILHYRQLAKLQSTYVEGLQKEMRADSGKIHTYFRQTIAATGRLSSQFPNLQNIPIRMEEGRKIRQFFLPSEEGWHILAADYSQIELRVLAHLSGDEGLKEAFHQRMDIHTKTAMDVFGVAESEVDSLMRRQAKAVNFGIVYGISDYGLSQNLNISRKAAADFISQYFEIFGGVKRFMEDIVKQARQDGYVTTLLHRRRYLPDIASSNFNKRSFAERTAMNTPIQGTAADIIKLAMIKMDTEMKRRSLRSRMLLQVHDELVFEVPPEEMDVMKQLLPDIMETALTLDVPLQADVSTGVNWYEAK